MDQIGGISNGGGPTFLGIMIFKIRVIKFFNYPHLVKTKLVQLGVRPIEGSPIGGSLVGGSPIGGSPNGVSPNGGGPPFQMF